MSEIKAGDKVKVEYEAKVLYTWQSALGTSLATLRRDGDGQNIVVKADYVTVTEPTYKTGQMHVDDAGVFYLRCKDAWVFAATGQRVPHDEPLRPLRKLVPEGT